MSKAYLEKYREYYTDNSDLDQILGFLGSREVTLSDVSKIELYRVRCHNLLSGAVNLPAIDINDVNSFCTIVAQHPTHVFEETRTNMPDIILSSAWALSAFNGYDEAITSVFKIPDFHQSNGQYYFRSDAMPSSRLRRGIKHIPTDSDLKIVARRIQAIEMMVLTLIDPHSLLANEAKDDFLVTCIPFIDSIGHNRLAQIMKDTTRDTNEALTSVKINLKIPTWSREERHRRRKAGLQTLQIYDESTFL
jgi:hypothetical protein